MTEKVRIKQTLLGGLTVGLLLYYCIMWMWKYEKSAGRQEPAVTERRDEKNKFF